VNYKTFEIREKSENQNTIRIFNALQVADKVFFGIHNRKPLELTRFPERRCPVLVGNETGIHCCIEEELGGGVVWGVVGDMQVVVNFFIVHLVVLVHAFAIFIILLIVHVLAIFILIVRSFAIATVTVDSRFCTQDLQGHATSRSVSRPNESVVFAFAAKPLRSQSVQRNICNGLSSAILLLG